MAIVNIYQAFDQSESKVWLGSITSKSSSEIILEDNITSKTKIIFFGNFSFDPNTGEFQTGFANAAQYYVNSQLVADLTNLSLDGFTVKYLLNPTFNNSLFTFALLENDSVSGSNYDDFIFSSDGNDVINGNDGDDSLSGGEGKDMILGGDGDDFIMGNEGDDRLDGNAGQDSILAGLGDDTITSTLENDFINGEEGNDTLNLIANLSGVSSIESGYLGGHKITDRNNNYVLVSNIETINFIDITIDFSSLIIDESVSESAIGTNSDDVIFANKSIVYANDGNDSIVHVDIGEFIDGGNGYDSTRLNFSSSEIDNVTKTTDGAIRINTSTGTTTILNVEQVWFTDDYVTSANGLLEAFPAPVVNTEPVFMLSNDGGSAIETTPALYTGAVTFLEYQLFGDARSNVVTGSSGNDFLNLLGGDDAANGGDGNDVLDGGTGSNFLTGGNGNDIFFLDGRSGETTWSTITDFSADEVNIWGWNDGVSQLVLTQESAGADGYRGATFHFDLNNDTVIDTSITFSGISLGAAPQSTSKSIEENGYLFFG